MKVLIISNALILLVNISAGGNGVGIEWSLLVVLTDCKHDLIRWCNPVHSRENSDLESVLDLLV